MKEENYVCLKCGKEFKLNSEINFCQSCGTKIVKDKKKSNDINFIQKQFTTADGVSVASAVIPEDYKIEAAINTEWISELVPVSGYIRAASLDDDIILASASKETLYDVKSGAMKGVISLIRNHTRNGYVNFLEPDEYIKKWAEAMSGCPLEVIAKTNLPSALGNNQEFAQSSLMNEINLYDMYMGKKSTVVNSITEPILYKFKGNLDGKDIIALAGADYQGAELSYNLPSFGSISKAASGIKNMFNYKNNNGGMLNDFMHGGLIGKMIRDKKVESSGAEVNVNLENKTAKIPDTFGYGFENGKPVDIVIFGSQRRYMCMALSEKEEEATKVFLSFIATIMPDLNLASREASLVQQKIQLMANEAANNQAMAQQMHMQTIRMQQQTSQMIANNSRQVSAGIMDSWDKKQAAQSRMSNNYSEAIRGVNTYMTPMGGTVEMSVSADHVYQNKYGDTIGVSGGAVDPQVASKLNWTELDKK